MFWRPTIFHFCKQVSTIAKKLMDLLPKNILNNPVVRLLSPIKKFPFFLEASIRLKSATPVSTGVAFYVSADQNFIQA